MSNPNPNVDITKLSTGISACKEPEVPIRIMFNEVRFSFGCLVSKLILTKASSSFMTISILSGPIPVDITVIRLPLYVPVWVLNSLF
ncbi:hypothetical protein D3C80_1438360 [compost metagenome]